MGGDGRRRAWRNRSDFEATPLCQALVIWPVTPEYHRSTCALSNDAVCRVTCALAPSCERLARVTAAVFQASAPSCAASASRRLLRAPRAGPQEDKTQAAQRAHTPAHTLQTSRHQPHCECTHTTPSRHSRAAQICGCEHAPSALSAQWTAASVCAEARPEGSCECARSLSLPPPRTLCTRTPGRPALGGPPSRQSHRRAEGTQDWGRLITQACVQTHREWSAHKRHDNRQSRTPLSALCSLLAPHS